MHINIQTTQSIFQGKFLEKMLANEIENTTGSVSDTKTWIGFRSDSNDSEHSREQIHIIAIYIS